MKKIFSYILIFISFTCLTLSVLWVSTVSHEYNTFSDHTTMSLLDYYLLFPPRNDVLIALSTAGIIPCIIVKIINYSKHLSIMSIVGLVLFSIELIVSTFLRFI